MGKLATQSLFWEFNKENPQYTLSSEDREHEGKMLDSIEKLYLQEMDVGEFEFAVKYFTSYKQWCAVKKAKWFAPTYQNMRIALEAKVQSQAIKNMMDMVADGTATQSTLKYLADKDFIPKEKVGRPTKKALEKEAERLTKQEKKFQEELDRITEHDPKIAKLR